MWPFLATIFGHKWPQTCEEFIGIGSKREIVTLFAGAVQLLGEVECFPEGESFSIESEQDGHQTQ